MPALSRHPASPSPWAERILYATPTRVGCIPAQGRNDGCGDALRDSYDRQMRTRLHATRFRRCLHINVKPRSLAALTKHQG